MTSSLAQAGAAGLAAEAVAGNGLADHHDVKGMGAGSATGGGTGEGEVPVGRFASWRGVALKARFKAAACHLGLSLSVAALVLLLVYGFWYEAPLAAVSGVGTILVLLLAVDVTLGPLLTFLVFNRAKKSLPMDLAFIALIQVSALVYGLYTVEVGRPHYLVFVKDRFEAISRADLQAEDLAAAAEVVSARVNWFGPSWVAVQAPDDEKVRQDVLIESALGGRDLPHFPQWYQPMETQFAQMKARALPLTTLRQLNPDKLGELDERLAALKKDMEQVAYLPLKGAEADAAVLIDKADGKALGMVDLKPW
ncbi:MAG: TfpX/TfpZ family type IV pilin accessory protein [Lautropia sp.]|nr:TfpX/TfpZ family type IV pilin accessory protein [Lautropia sp.]